MQMALSAMQQRPLHPPFHLRHCSNPRPAARSVQAAGDVEAAGAAEAAGQKEDLGHVGLVVWQSAFLLAELLTRRPPWGTWSDVRVVDLGTGTGGPCTLEHLRLSLEGNRGLNRFGPQTGGQPESRPSRWSLCWCNCWLWR